MIKRTALLFAVAASCCYATANDTDRRAGVVFDEPTALNHAVAQFNAQVNRVSEIGRTQPPLTVDEIVAAIRAWDTKQNPIQPELHAIFEMITETRTLPPGSEIDVTTGWNPGRGYRYTVWWVNLNVSAPNPDKEDSRVGYAYRIRDRKLSSRPSGEPINRHSQQLSDAERQRYIAKFLLGLPSRTEN